MKARYLRATATTSTFQIDIKITIDDRLTRRNPSTLIVSHSPCSTHKQTMSKTYALQKTQSNNSINRIHPPPDSTSTTTALRELFLA